MPGTLVPAFAEILYHSSAAPHVMRLPTLAWNDDASPGGAGSFESWSGVDKDAEDMVEQLVDLMLPFFNNLITFDGFIVYTQAEDPGIALPVASGSFTGKVGTGGGDTWFAAVQTTIIARTSEFGIAKLVLLDSNSGDNFTPELVQSAPMAALTAEWFSLENGWRGRDGGRPKTFVKATQTLNEKLRREYRYT